MANANTGLCPEEKINNLVTVMRGDERRGMRDLDGLLRDYSGDPRLHFLKGSMLAGRQDYDGARSAMRQAIDLAPDYGVARFQLGLLLLSSGQPHEAQETWGPLHSLPPSHPLHLFVKGLCHMIKDEFGDAVKFLEEGISRNTENAPMNRDMEMILTEIRSKTGRDSGETAISSVDFLLQQSGLKPRH